MDRFDRNLTALLALAFAALTAASAHAGTVGYWRFEGDDTGTEANQQAEGNFLDDASANDIDLMKTGSPETDQRLVSTTAIPSIVPRTGATNTHAADFGTTRSNHLFADDAPALAVGSFTIEMFLRRESSGTGVVRYMASQWLTSGNNRAWAFGMNDGDSRFGNGELLMLLSEAGSDTILVESDFTGSNLIEVDKDYYTAAVFDQDADTLTFYLQNLTDGGPLVSTTKSVTINSLHDSGTILRIGTYNGENGRRWGGLLDEVRLSDMALEQRKLLISPIPTPAALPAGLALMGLTLVRRRPSRR